MHRFPPLPCFAQGRDDAEQRGLTAHIFPRQSWLSWVFGGCQASEKCPLHSPDQSPFFSSKHMSPVPCSDQRAPLTTNLTTDTDRRPQTTGHRPQHHSLVPAQAPDTHPMPCVVCGQPGRMDPSVWDPRSFRPQPNTPHDQSHHTHNLPGRGLNRSDYNRGQFRPPAPMARPKPGTWPRRRVANAIPPPQPKPQTPSNASNPSRNGNTHCPSIAPVLAQPCPAPPPPAAPKTG